MIAVIPGVVTRLGGVDHAALAEVVIQADPVADIPVPDLHGADCSGGDGKRYGRKKNNEEKAVHKESSRYQTAKDPP